MKEETASLNARHLRGADEFFKLKGSDVQDFRPAKNLLIGVAGLFSAAPIAFLIYRINAASFDQPEKAVTLIGVLSAFLLILPSSVYLLARRGEAKLNDLGLTFVGAVAVLLVAVYLFTASFYITFPADFLIWSESDFVNDILKFRQGYPIFTPNANNESFTYVPGAQFFTYFLAWLAGYPTSVPAYRAVQVFFTFLAAIVAFSCCRRLLSIFLPNDEKIAASPLWAIIWMSGFFLIATNSLTNPFAHLLHNDALAQLVSVTAYRLLIEYEATKDRRILWLMCLVPAAGFWVKQSLIVWAILYAVYLLVFDRPRSFKQAFYFALAAFGGVLLSFLIGYALWREEFIYWIFTVLGKHGVSPLRSVRHTLEIWIYFAAGLFGGAVLLQAAGLKKLFGLWLVWLVLIFTQTYTSGVAWMMNHIGAGCLIAAVWFFAAAAVVWTNIASEKIKDASRDEWLRASVAAAVLCLLFSGFGVVRVPVQPFGADAERYVREIEKEFKAEAPDRVLLDFGTWLYLPGGVVMKDRAPTIGERGWSQTGDFSGITNRLEQKYYRKIMVRNLHSPNFWYDYASWQRSSGIKKTLLENYQQIGTITPVAGINPNEMPYGFSEISILVPRAD